MNLDAAQLSTVADLDRVGRIAHHKNFSVSPCPRVSASPLTRGLQLDMILLVVHGSRNSRYNAAVQQLKGLVHQELMAIRNLPAGSTTLVDVAFLEAHPLPLHEQIANFADRAAREGIYRIQLLPLFLLPGVHVREDIPAEVARARKIIRPGIALELLPYLGSQERALSRLLMSQMATVENPPLTPPSKGGDRANVWILFSHGSRRPGGNRSVEAIAHQLAELSGVRVVTAYSFVPPFLSDRVAELVNIGDRRMAILPYLLFQGELTLAIARSVPQLCQTFPDLQLQVTQPIAATNDLPRLIASASQF